MLLKGAPGNETVSSSHAIVSSPELGLWYKYAPRHHFSKASANQTHSILYIHLWITDLLHELQHAIRTIFIFYREMNCVSCLWKVAAMLAPYMLLHFRFIEPSCSINVTESVSHFSRSDCSVNSPPSPGKDTGFWFVFQSEVVSAAAARTAWCKWSV